jgi:hypothetical protein
LENWVRLTGYYSAVHDRAIKSKSKVKRRKSKIKNKTLVPEPDIEALYQEQCCSHNLGGVAFSLQRTLVRFRECGLKPNAG